MTISAYAAQSLAGRETGVPVVGRHPGGKRPQITCAPDPKSGVSGCIEENSYGIIRSGPRGGRQGLVLAPRGAPPWLGGASSHRGRFAQKPSRYPRLAKYRYDFPNPGSATPTQSRRKTPRSVTNVAEGLAANDVQAKPDVAYSSGHSESYDGVNVKPSSIQPVTPPIIIFTGKPSRARRNAALLAPLQCGPAQ